MNRSKQRFSIWDSYLHLIFDFNPKYLKITPANLILSNSLCSNSDKIWA